MNNEKEINNAKNSSIKSNKDQQSSNNSINLMSFGNQSDTDKDSLQILNMDEMKDFTCDENTLKLNGLNITEQLQRERELALATLRKSRYLSQQQQSAHNNTNNPTSNNNTNLSCLFGVGRDKSNLINRCDDETSFNISELALSKTVDVKTPIRYSFEPSEITGRSTMCENRRKNNLQINKNIYSPTVEEILSTSCSEEVRNIYGSGNVRDSYNKISLPRTADISRQSSSSINNSSYFLKKSNYNQNYWDELNGDFDDNEFNFSKQSQNHKSLQTSSFCPAEENYDKLLADEIKWQQEYAVIPETDHQHILNLNEELPVKQMKETIGHFQEHINLTDFSGFLGSGNISLASSDKSNVQMSISTYFDNNSDDLKKMIPNMSPVKKKPSALIDTTYNSDDESDENVMDVNSFEIKEQSKYNKDLAMELEMTQKLKTYELPSPTTIKLKDTKEKQKLSKTTQALLDAATAEIKEIEKRDEIEKINRRNLQPLLDITAKIYAMEYESNNNHKKKSSSSSSKPINTNKPITMPKITITKPTEKTTKKPIQITNDSEKSQSYTSFSNDLGKPIDHQHQNTQQQSRTTSDQSIEQLSETTASFSDSLLESSAFNSSECPSPIIHSTDISSSMASSSGSVGINTKTYNLTSLTTPTSSANVTPEKSIENQLNVDNKRRSKKRSRSSLEISELKQNAADKNNSKLFKSPPPPLPPRNIIADVKHKQSQLNFIPISPKQQKQQHRENLYIPGALKATQSSPIIQQQHQHEKNYQNENNNSIDNIDDLFSQLFVQTSSSSSSSSRSPINTGKLSLPIFGSNTNNNHRAKSESPTYRQAQLYSNMIRSNSQCSTSSEYNPQSEILPIKATHSEISWGSIKLRKTVEKSIQIKNISPKRLTLRLKITGPGFQLSGSEKNGSLTLQGLECRSIAFVFCPTVIGPAIGYLMLQPPIENATVGKRIRLYGYGGHTNVSIDGVQKGPIGSAFLPLGDIKQLQRPIETTFTLTNKGTLPAFATIEFQTKGKDITLMNPSLYITPQKLIIQPQNSTIINIKFKPYRDEIKKLIKKNADVLTVTNLLIVTGDEPCRHRIKRLINERKKNEKTNKMHSQLNNLCTKFYREEHTDINGLNENWNVINELISTFRTQDLALTINRNMDETIIDFSLDNDDDESILFHTIASEAQMQMAIDKPISVNDVLQSNSRTSGESWLVQPKFLEITPNSKDTKILKVKSNFYSTQLFEVNSNIRNLFQFQPAEGEIKPGQEIEIQIKIITSGTFLPPSQDITIMILVENESITVPVFIRPENFMPPKRRQIKKI